MTTLLEVYTHWRLRGTKKIHFLPALAERDFKTHIKPVKKLKIQQTSLSHSWISMLKEQNHQETIDMQDVDQDSFSKSETFKKLYKQLID